MSTSATGVVFVVSLVAALAAAHKVLGDYMYRVVSGNRHSRVERVVYRLVG